MQPEYVRFSEERNALDYLEKTIEFIRRAEQYPADWKWVVLSLHGALYGFMICALKGTDPDRVLIGKKNQKPKLISFSTALDWCQDPTHMTMTTESRVLQLSEDQKRSLDILQMHFRNSFAHYRPCLWSIELHTMPRIVMDGLNVARFLSLETGNFLHLTGEDCGRIDALLDEGVRKLHESPLLRDTTQFLE